MPAPLVKVAPSTLTFGQCFWLPHSTLTGDRSNLTFGAGGKDSSGVVRAGWGYYEVSDSHLPRFSILHVNLLRPSPAVREPGQVGTGRRAYTPTSPIPASEMPE